MEIVLMNDDSIIPTRASKRPAGLELYSGVDVNIEVVSIKKINTGQKIAQLIGCNILYPEIKKVKCLKKTERNDKGFGKINKIDLDKELDKLNKLSEKEIDEIFKRV